MFAIVMMAGCDSLNPSERLNVGKWYTSINHVSDSVGGFDYTGEQYDDYNEDKTCSSKEQSDLLLIQETEYKKL